MQPVIVIYYYWMQHSPNVWDWGITQCKHMYLNVKNVLLREIKFSI